jgi:hypothetical protein
MAATATPRHAQSAPAPELHLEGREYPVTRSAAVLFGALIAAVVTVGAFSELVRPIEGFGLGSDLTTRFNVPAAVTLVLLLVAAQFALLRGRIAQGRERYLWWGLSLAFAYLCLDQAVGIHNRVEGPLGADPELLYVPLVVAACALWVLALRGLEADPIARVLWVAGAGLWGLSQEIELLALGRASFEVPLTLPEEALEMLGTALFALAILRYLESHAVPWVVKVREERPGLLDGVRSGA